MCREMTLGHRALKFCGNFVWQSSSAIKLEAAYRDMPSAVTLLPVKGMKESEILFHREEVAQRALYHREHEAPRGVARVYAISWRRNLRVLRNFRKITYIVYI